MNVTWKKPARQNLLYFKDLGVGQGYRILGYDAVYMKIQKKKAGGTIEYRALEIATGTSFFPTSSPVEKVDIEIIVGASKPAIY